MAASDKDPVRSVAVVGCGASALLTAIALDRAFRRTGLAITLIETPSQSHASDVYVALPDLAGFHRRLGIAEHQLFTQADAVFSMGQQFVGWSGGQDIFLHAYGETGSPLHELPFLQFWLRGRAQGLSVAYDEFCLAAVAARNDRMAPPGDNSGHGYHFDANGYHAILRSHAQALGMTILKSAMPAVMASGTQITGLVTSDGQSVTADLYVDATGDARHVMKMLDTDAGKAACPTGPCDRIAIASGAALNPIPLYSRIMAVRHGWHALVPLADRTARIVAYHSTAMSDDEATHLTGGSNAVVRAIAPVTSLQPWIGNCVAIGASGCPLDPLVGLDLHRDQIGISHLVALMPVDRTRMIEAAIYNEEVVGHYQRLTDFQHAQYRLNARVGDPYWDAARAGAISEGLHYKLDLFGVRGMMTIYNQESFNADSWQTVMIGHGVVPKSWDPQADIIPDSDVTNHFRTLLSGVKAGIAPMISHAEARARAARHP